MYVINKFQSMNQISISANVSGKARLGGAVPSKVPKQKMRCARNYIGSSGYRTPAVSVTTLSM